MKELRGKLERDPIDWRNGLTDAAQIIGIFGGLAVLGMCILLGLQSGLIPTSEPPGGPVYRSEFEIPGSGQR